MIGQKRSNGKRVVEKANPPSTSRAIKICLKRSLNPSFSMDTIPPSRKLNWRITGIPSKWASPSCTKPRPNLGYVNIHLIMYAILTFHYRFPEETWTENTILPSIICTGDPTAPEDPNTSSIRWVLSKKIYILRQRKFSSSRLPKHFFRISATL